MIEQWLSTSWTQALLVLVSTVGIFAAVITYTRLAGLRSFSKMSAFDFASTVAVGSLMATVAVTEASLLDGVIALGAIYAVQLGIALLRRRSVLEKVVDNDPVLLMAGGRLLEENMRSAKITRRDIAAKLRAANVTSYDQVLGVVLETTGDVSVLSGTGPLEPELLEGVRGAEQLR